jgi:hypothetical protein
MRGYDYWNIQTDSEVKWFVVVSLRQAQTDNMYLSKLNY